MEMFAKLAAKYSAPNPLSTNHSITYVLPSTSLGPSVPAKTPAFESKPFQASPFNNTSAMMQPVVAAPSPSPFGAPATTSTPAFRSTSTFGVSSQSGFSSSFAGSSGQTQSTSQSHFGGSNIPFGNTASTPSFGSPTISSSGATFGGKTPREILIQFYQQYNPSKIGEVDKLLAKYAGNEENLLRNLARKYNVDERVFGLSTATAPPNFGSAPPLSAFGAGASNLGGSPAPPSFGSSAFGAGSTPLGGGPVPSSFVSSPQSSAFGAGASQPFGSSSGMSFGTLAAGGQSGSTAPMPAPFGGGGFGSFGGGFTSVGATPFGSARR